MKTKRINAVIGATLVVAALQFAAPASAEDQAGRKQHSTTGTINAVDANQRAVKVRHLLLTRDFNLANDCAIAVGNKTQANVADLKPGMEVDVCYTDADGVRVATRIEQQKVSRTGSIQAVDTQNRKLTLDQGALTKHFRIGEGCRYVMNDDKTGTLNDLKVGQRVTISYVKNGDVLEAMKIEQPHATFVGTLNAIDADAETVKAKHLLSNQRFTLGDDCRIVINGKRDGKLSDLRLGEKVAIDYRDVNGVYVATRIAPAQATETTEPHLSRAGK